MIAVLAAGVDEVLDVAPQCASDDDRLAAGARQDEELRRRTLAGRAALRLLAAWGRGVPLERADELEISRQCPDCGGRHGRPTSQDLSLSSSSSAGRVLVAIADPEDAIGISLETLPQHLCAEFDARALHPDERLQVPDADRAAGIAARIEIWTLKEAARKASGLSLRTEPSSLRIDEHPDLDSPEWRVVHGAPASGSSRAPIRARALKIDGRARAAIATNRPQAVRIWTMPALLTELGCLPDTGYDAGELSHLC